MDIPSNIVTSFMDDSFEQNKVYLFKNKEYVDVDIDMNLKKKIIDAIKASARVRDEIKNSI